MVKAVKAAAPKCKQLLLLPFNLGHKEVRGACRLCCRWCCRLCCRLCWVWFTLAPNVDASVWAF